MVTLKQLDEKYGGRREISLAFLHGKLTAEEEECVRLYMNMSSVLSVASEELIRLNQRFLDKLDLFTRKAP